MERISKNTLIDLNMTYLTRVVETNSIKIGLNETIFHTLISNIAIHVGTRSG